MTRVVLNPALNTRTKLAYTYSLVALVVASAILVFGPAAVDQAAHFHLQWIYSIHGFSLWDNTWYLGRYSFVNYSFLLYFIASVLGLKVVAALSISMIVGLASYLCDCYFPDALTGPRRMSLLVLPLLVITGAWPFLLGCGLVLLALVMRRSGKKFLFLLFTFLTLLTSPLALLGQILVVASLEIPIEKLQVKGQLVEFLKESFSNFYLYVIAITGIIQFISMKIFPDHGFYPYWWTDLVGVELFVVVALLLINKETPGFKKLRALFVLYGVVNLIAFVLRSNLGSNASRVGDFALPITVVLIAQRRRFSYATSISLVILALIWNLMPTTQVLSSSIYRISGPSIWRALKPVLSKYTVPGSRVELVDTVNHEGDYYLPQMGFPIVRGWFRQDDFPSNSLLYMTKFDAKQYLSWLVSSGASVVVLPPGPYDFSSSYEAKLIESGKSGLIPLATVAGSELFRVPGSPTIINRQGSNYLNAKIGVGSISFTSPGGGTYNLRLFYSPYLQPSEGTICRNTKGMTTWMINGSGSRRLVFKVTIGKMASVLFGNSGAACK